MVAGARVDYLAPTLYLLDLVWLGLLIIQRSKIKDQKLIQNLKTLLENKRLWVMAGLVVINIWVAERPEVAIYKWLRFGQLVWVILRIYESRNLRIKIKNSLGWIIPIWIVMESWLGLAQVVNGGSLEGIWYWLGERRFALGGIGLAEWQVAGENMIRAYGTFSHPNSLAGFLLVVLIYWLGIYESRNLRIKNVYKWIVVWSGVLGIVLSGSRMVWGVGILAAIFNLKFLIFKQFLSIKFLNFRKTIGYGAVFGGVIILILGLVSINYEVGDFVGGWDRNSINKRLELVRQAGEMIKKNPLFGVGAGNFLVAQPKFEIEGKGRWRQPVHNIFLLWVSEMGIITTIFLISNFQFLISKQIQKFKNKLIILGIIGMTGMVDHYWLTLPQNWWLMAIMLAV